MIIMSTYPRDPRDSFNLLDLDHAKLELVGDHFKGADSRVYAHAHIIHASYSRAPHSRAHKSHVQSRRLTLCQMV